MCWKYSCLIAIRLVVNTRRRTEMWQRTNKRQSGRLYRCAELMMEEGQWMHSWGGYCWSAAPWSSSYQERRDNSIAVWVVLNCLCGKYNGASPYGCCHGSYLLIAECGLCWIPYHMFDGCSMYANMWLKCFFKVWEMFCGLNANQNVKDIYFYGTIPYCTVPKHALDFKGERKTMDCCTRRSPR